MPQDLSQHIEGPPEPFGGLDGAFRGLSVREQEPRREANRLQRRLRVKGAVTGADEVMMTSVISCHLGWAHPPRPGLASRGGVSRVAELDIASDYGAEIRAADQRQQ
jgi:hypothetical protein